MTFIKGGRGRKAPYESTHIRVPEPIKPRVEEMMERFKSFVAEEGLSVEEAISKINSQPFEDCFSKQQIIESARFGLRSKKGAWVTVQKMLTSLFNKEVSVEELKGD